MENNKYLTSDFISLEVCDFNYITVISEIEYKNYSYFQSKFKRFDIGIYEGNDYYKPVNIALEYFKEISDEEYDYLDKLLNLYNFDFDFLSAIMDRLDEFCSYNEINWECPNNFWNLPEEEFKKSLDEFISKFKEEFENYYEEDLYIIKLA